MKKIGRYEILEELGRGAMGVVYKASDPTIGRMVAIKVLSLSDSPSEGLPDAREIFLREARAAGRLSHPGIVTIHDALEDPETGASYIVMEFIAGRTLESMLISGPPLEMPRVLDIVRQVAEALDYAHREKVIHRDLKPANILLTQDNRAKITDFGIAKIVARETASRTVAVMGTPSYMSPEQVTGQPLDNRTDLFSMGIILFMMLTGQKPFIGDTAAVMFKIVSEDPVPPSKLNAKLTLGHDYLALRCLAKDPKKRYSTAREFLEDLKDVEDGRPPRSEASISLSDLRPGEPTLMAGKPVVTVPVAPQVGLDAKRTLRAVGIGAGCGILVLVVGGLWNLRHRAPTPVPAPPRAGGAVPAPAAAVQPSPASPPSAVPAVAKPVSEPTSGVKRTHRVAPVKPATLAAAAPESRPAPTTAARDVQFRCTFELQEATLTVSAGGQAILNKTLKGKKKGGLLGLKGKYVGSFSVPIRIPRGARELLLHVVTSDGSVDLTKKVPIEPPTGASQDLHVVVTSEHLTPEWHSGPHQ